MKRIEEVTGLFWWTFEEGLKALEDNKAFGYFSIVNQNNGFIAYETLIKGEPDNPETQRNVGQLLIDMILESLKRNLMKQHNYILVETKEIICLNCCFGKTNR